MGMLSVEQPQGNAPKTSALENAAKVLGIVSSVGQAASSGYNAFVNTPAQIDLQKQNLDAAKGKMIAQSASPGAPVTGNVNPNNFNMGIKQ